MLRVQNIRKDFGGIKAVDGCSFEVARGKITALIGPNGAGKTTMFNIITGFMKQDTGNIIFKGEDITPLPDYKRCRLGLSRTFQSIRLFPKMTVMENMLVAMHSNESILQALFMAGEMRAQERKLAEDAREILRFVSLDTKANELAGNLSYGQQKLLEIAKALASEPEVLMLDEPAAGVNPTMLNKIRELMLKLKKKGRTIIFIEHNMEFVMGVADKVVVMDYGKEIAYDVPEKVQKNKRVIDAYLGVEE